MFGLELFGAIAMIAGSLVVCFMSLRVPLALAPHFWAGAGAFPFILGALVFFLSSCWLFDLLKRRPAPKAGAPGVRAWLEEVVGPPDRQKRLFRISCLALVFVFVLIPLFARIDDEYGFMGATFIFIFAGLKLFTDFSGPRLLAIAAVTSGCIWAIFTYGLMLPMPR